MSLVKLLPAWLHAIADYAVGALLIVVALTVDMTDAARLTGLVVGAVVLAVSMATRYPLGVVKVLPFRIHSLGDYAAAALLVVAPFALGFRTDDPAVTAVYIGVAVAVVAVSLITNYQYGSATTDEASPLPTAESAPAPRVEATPRPAHRLDGTVRRPRPLRAAGR